MKLLRHTEERTKRDRIRNQILTKGTGVQNLTELEEKQL
jgi:hypothetical protein